VSGTLPLTDLPGFVIWKDTAELSLARCHLDVTAGGKVKLRLNSPAGLTLWLNGNPIDAKEEIVIDVQPGLQTLTVAIDRTLRKDGLRCWVEDITDSPARVSVVGGK
jgi:hypothetical protein